MHNRNYKQLQTLTLLTTATVTEEEKQNFSSFLDFVKIPIYSMEQNVQCSRLPTTAR